MVAGNIRSGRLLRYVNKTGSVWGTGITEKVVWVVVREFAKNVSLDKLAPHDLVGRAPASAMKPGESWNRFNSC